MSLTRRKFAKLIGLLISTKLIFHSGFVVAGKNNNDLLSKKLTEIEKRLGARMGVAIVDTATGKQWAHRSGERFPMCSTFKVLACAAVLSRVDAGKEDLNRRISIAKSDLVPYSPVTEKRVTGEAMTLAEICEAAITRSDNTAGNLILKSLGGPDGVTEFTRTLGDPVTQLDRFETELNEATPGDTRDTTTPSAMTANLRVLVLEKMLSEKSREQLKMWLIANKTGDAKLRAGLPKNWIVGDKTGAGEHGSVNDVAVIWPINRKPVIVSIYITETTASFADSNTAIAEIARALTTALR